MDGFVTNIEKSSEENKFFRQVLFTSKNLQLVVMSLKPREDIGTETHQLDQFIRVEKGSGKSVLNGVESALESGFAVIVPAGVEHNIVNVSETENLKLYTVYAPPNHADGTIHKTKSGSRS